MKENLRNIALLGSTGSIGRQTLDIIDGNRSNIVDRDFQPVSVRYLRLYVVSPTQGTGGATRIYELSIY